MVRGSRYIRLLSERARQPTAARVIKRQGRQRYSTIHEGSTFSDPHIPLPPPAGPSAHGDVTEPAGQVGYDYPYAPSSSLPKTYGPSTSPPRLRFAPSPTGHLHLGGLRTALLNHIVARQGKGKWVLRVEDTDRDRLIPGSIDQMRSVLDWVGIEYDEGPGAPGSYGPYVQSERLDLYQHYIKQLLESDHAYECFCTVDDLAAARASWKGKGAFMNYDGRCRHLTDEERVRRKKAGKKHVVRWKDPDEHVEMPEDLIFGHVKAHSDVGGPFEFGSDDIILLKADGYPTYHFANVVDDHAMEISHVIRGEDWLQSLPKHIALYNAFGWTPPIFAHIPVLCNSDGTKLSKRQAHTSADYYRDQGFEPEAIINYLTLLGWDHTRNLNAATDSQPVPAEAVRRDNNSYSEVFTLPQLIESFDLGHVTRRKALINIDKLEFLNKMHLRKRAGLLGDHGQLIAAGKTRENMSLVENNDREAMIREFQRALKKNSEISDSPLVDNWEFVAEIFEYEMPRIRRFKELSEDVTFWFKDPTYATSEAEALQQAVKREDYVRFLEFVIPRLDKIATESNHFKKDDGWIMANRAHQNMGLKHRGGVLKAMRHALTGQMQGPSVPDIMFVLGPDTVLRRLKAGLDFVKSQR